MAAAEVKVTDPCLRQADLSFSYKPDLFILFFLFFASVNSLINKQQSFHPVDTHTCLLDCVALDLQEMSIFAAERLPECSEDANPESSNLTFSSFSFRRTGENLLKDCCRLQLKIERNLDKYVFAS